MTFSFNTPNLGDTNTDPYNDLFNFGAPVYGYNSSTPLNLKRAGSFGSVTTQNPQQPLTGFGGQPLGLGGGLGEPSQTSWFDSLLGEKGKTALGGIGMLANLYMGMQNFGLAKDSFRMQKENYDRNYAAQQQMTNSRMEDRQRARVASNADAYEAVDSYMDRNKVR